MIISRTPFRISFFGGGTDYPVWYEKYGGAVLSATINKYCYITCRYLPPFFNTKSRVVWSKIELVNDANEIEHPTARESLKYLGINEGVEIHHHADLPARSGLGSSSAFTVGLLNALHALKQEEVTKQELALNAIHVEQERARENVGSQDQVAVAYGGVNRIDFGGPNKVEVSPLNIPVEREKALEGKLMMFFTGLSRTASEIAKSQIENTPKKEKELHRMRELVDQAQKILLDPDAELDELGSMFDETWRLKRSLSHLISNDCIDEIYSKAKKAGAMGGKLLGAGGGGFILFYVDPAKQEVVKKSLSNLIYVPFEFDKSGSQIVHNSGNLAEVMQAEKISE